MIAFGGKPTSSGCCKSDADDPKRHFATANCRTANGAFDHLVGTSEQSHRDGRVKHRTRSLVHKLPFARKRASLLAGNILAWRAHPVVDLDVACAAAAQGSAVKCLIVSPSSQGTALLSILARRSSRRLEPLSWPAPAPPEPHRRGPFRNRHVKTHSTVRVLNHDKSGTNLPIRDSRS
jgi:hypothetical protein